jgi:tripartite ATP-independent transporter DctP family solute receptor
MKRFGFFLLAVILISALVFSFGIPKEVNAKKKGLILKYGHVETKESPQQRFAEDLSDRLSKATDGRILIEVYPANQLGSMSEMLEGVKSGSIEMAHHVHASLAKYYPDIAVFSLPYIYRDMDHGLKASSPNHSPLVREMNEELIKRGGMRVVGCFSRGYRNLSTNFPVYSLKDLKGKKIRGIPLQLWMSTIKGMGAIPVPVDIAEVSTALMTGLIEGQENPLQQQWQAKYYEVQKYIIMTEHIMDLLPVFINEKVWQSLSKSDKAVFERCIDEAIAKETELAKKAEIEFKDKFRKKGMTIIEEKDGLDKKGIRAAVVAQREKDFPQWADYVKRIQEVK